MMLLDAATRALAPSLFTLLLHRPFVAWVEQSHWRLCSLLLLGELGIILLLQQWQYLNVLAWLMLNVMGLLLIFTPLFLHLRKQNREQLEHILRLNAIINAHPDALLFKDPKGRWLNANPAGQSLFQLQTIPWHHQTGIQPSSPTPELVEMPSSSKADDESSWSIRVPDTCTEMLADDQGNTRHFQVSKLPLFNPDNSRYGMVIIGRDVSEIIHAQNQLEKVANHDQLTGLANRRLLNELMGHAIRRAEREQNRIALLFIDLDRFKTINDSLGHQIGDKLLVEVSQRLNEAVRDSDAIARVGGDEFVVMMDSLRDIEDAAVVAKKIIQSIGSEFIIDGKEFFIGASIGISIYPDNGREMSDLIKAADIAMYQVKSDGKNNYHFYSANMSENANERFVLETQLRHALERNQFEVYYQPQISLASGKIIGAEALMRWQHPELGTVSPAKFIPLAEEMGLIIQIGEWVLRESINQAMQWLDLGYALQGVSVNVSGIQIQRSNFGDTVYGLLVETGCEPGILELEITESTITQNTEHVIGVFNRLKNMGVRMAIDDFGTGYSSLSQLKRLPLDKLKIDQSFVHELPQNTDDAVIANAVYALGHSLGLTVIAEGVETIEQADFLRQMGCDEAQGYLYGRPVPAAEFTRLLESDQLKKPIK